MAWKILNTESKISDGYVVEVYSVYEKQDGHGYAKKSFKNIFQGMPSDDFIPYEDLTEDIIIGWVKESLGPIVVLETEAIVDAQAALANAEVIYPEYKKGLPWDDNTLAP